jgi:hypothetical protein
MVNLPNLISQLGTSRRTSSAASRGITLLESLLGVGSTLESNPLGGQVAGFSGPTIVVDFTTLVRPSIAADPPAI